MSNRKTLFLVDSSIFVFKAWFALPDTMQTGDGHVNNAFIGFSDFVYQLLSREKPKQIVFCFDESLKSSHRNEIYPEYKANRETAPPELKRQFQWCRQWVRALGISEVASDRYEADDLIGSLARLHRSPSCRIVILTADKDLAQLIREGDVWWSWHAAQQLNYKALIRKFGVKPEQIADQLALAGDKVDNIPGIPGIGMAIAARLLTRFKTLENLRQNIDQVETMKFRGASRIMGLLREHEAVLDISSQLTPIECGVEVMYEVDIDRGKIDRETIGSMIEQHKMGQSRKDKWAVLLAERDCIDG